METNQRSSKPYPVLSRAIIMVHGRGSSGTEISRALRSHLPLSGFKVVAPTAPGNTWYPSSFIAPIAQNEPWLTDSIAQLNEIVNTLIEEGYQYADIHLLGFSQGACLAMEFAARQAKRLGGLYGFSGGLIGKDLNLKHYQGDFQGTPVFLGCSDIDPHIPLSRVKESTHILEVMGAQVTEKIYPGGTHSINGDELEIVSKMLQISSSLNDEVIDNLKN